MLNFGGVCLISPFIIFRSLITPSFGAPTGCRGMDSNTWNQAGHGHQHLQHDPYDNRFLPKNLWPITGVSSTVQPLHPCYFWWQHVVWKVKSQKASVAVFCSSSCGQVYRAIGSNSDCCQWCDDWIPNGSLFVNSWFQREGFTMDEGVRVEKNWRDSNNGTVVPSWKEKDLVVWLQVWIYVGTWMDIKSHYVFLIYTLRFKCVSTHNIIRILHIPGSSKCVRRICLFNALHLKDYQKELGLHILSTSLGDPGIRTDHIIYN